MEIYKLKRRLLSAVYPNRCPFCNEIIGADEYYCSKCILKLDFLKADNGRIMHICVWDDEARKIVYKMKNENNGYAVSMIASLMYDRLELLGKTKDFDLIVPVPMTKKDRRRRGYNQCTCIGNELAELMGTVCDENVLCKVKKTLAQKTLNENNRKINMKNVFALSGKAEIYGKNILVLDDICTTGSTLSEAFRALSVGNPASVSAITFAKTKNVSGTVEI